MRWICLGALGLLMTACSSATTTHLLDAALADASGADAEASDAAERDAAPEDAAALDAANLDAANLDAANLDATGEPPDVGPEDAGAFDAAPADTDRADSSLAVCPAAIPADGSPCGGANVPRICEYGGDTHGVCSTLAECGITGAGQAPHWIVTPPFPGCGTAPAGCPGSFASADGKVCTSSTTPNECDYGEGRCGCEPCRTQGPGFGYAWRCNAWSAVPTGCPSPRPVLGTPCAMEGQVCNYGLCCRGPSLGLDQICMNGVWSPWVDTGCSCFFPSCP
jgi:hypothetical protein